MLNKPGTLVLSLTVVASLFLMSWCLILDDPYYTYHTDHYIYDDGYVYDDGYYYYDYYPSLNIYYDTRRRLYYYPGSHGAVGRRYLPHQYRNYRRHQRRRVRSRYAQPHQRRRSGKRRHSTNKRTKSKK